jgi:hypothetical protein
VALALTLRASKTDFSLPRPTLQVIRPVANKAREPSRRRPQTAAFFARPQRSPAAAETCTALIWQRSAVAERSLIRLRKQKLLRQVFERLQDRLLCTFLEAD